MAFERKIEVLSLKEKKKKLIQELGISNNAYKRHFPKMSRTSRDYVVLKNPEGKDMKQHLAFAPKGMSLKQQVLYLEEMVRIRNENKEAIDKLEKEMKEKAALAAKNKENSNEK